MSRLTRRDFLKNTMAAGVASVFASPYSRVLGANDDIRLAVVGTGGQGSNHMDYFNKLPGVRVVAICDVDKSHLDSSASKFEKKYGQKLTTYADVRRLLEDKSIDAITSATPNHWHSLVTVWACQAGKDVYIEKPVSHEIWEGRKMVEAARKYNRIVQAGTQRRSSEAYRNAFEYINQGNIGKILWVRGLCYKVRNSIGKVSGPQPIPQSCDYNLWCGPADREPLMRKSLHYDWHWVWNTGCGDIGNQGAHEMDEARWALGQKGLPQRVISIGGRFGYDDDGETANTQIVFFDYKPAPLIFEVHGLPRKKGINARDIYRGIDIGFVVQCEDGYFAAGTAGGWIYDNNGERIKQFAGHGGGEHHQNFIDAIRSRKVSDLNADIKVGHISAALCHMGNISYRLGRTMPTEEITETIKGNNEMMESFERMLTHFGVNDINLEKTPATIGPMLTMDPKKEEFVGEHSKMANMLIKRNYREPFVVPDKV